MCCCSTRAPRVRSATTASWSRTCTSTTRWSRSPLTSSRWCCSPRRGSGGPTWWWVRLNGSGSPWPTAAPTRRSSPPARSSSATCPGGWSACRSTPKDAARCASRCRRASSTSAARRPPATSAPRRCSWPTSPGCTRCTTVPRGCAPSPSACTRSPPDSRRRYRGWCTKRASTRSRCASTTPMTCSRARATRASTCDASTAPPCASRSTRPPPCSSSSTCGRCSATRPIATSWGSPRRCAERPTS